MGLAYWGAAMQAYRAKLVIDAQLNVVWTTAQELKLVPPAPPDVAHPNLEKSFPHTSKALRSLQSIGNPRNGTSQHTDVDYWRTTNGMAVCLLLLVRRSPLGVKTAKGTGRRAGDVLDSGVLGLFVAFRNSSPWIIRRALWMDSEPSRKFSRAIMARDF